MTKASDQDQRAELRRMIDAWATQTPSKPHQNFTWSPPVPVVLTGIRVSCAVAMTKVVLANRIIAAPALEVPPGSAVVALPSVVSERISFPDCIFMPGDQALGAAQAGLERDHDARVAPRSVP